jgi:hypothetical protein
MTTSKALDIVLLTDEFSRLSLIEPILQEFKAAVRAESLIDNSGMYGVFGARGTLSETAHQFGPVLTLKEEKGRIVSMRIPWQHIRAVISGVDPETDGKRYRFGISKRVKPNPK